MTQHFQNSQKGLKGVALYVDLGLRFAIAIALGVGGGYWLDSKFDTVPLFLIIGLLLGATSGFLTIYRAAYPSSTKAEKGE
ncbi:AtpZ/AtpI family protein [bacterium]|nr:AtpZ/AtpI family protein [bacterium]